MWWDDLNGLLLFATKQDALLELKTAIKASGEHKQRVIIHIAVDGLKIRDEKTGVKRTVFLFPFIMILILTFYPILKAERLKWKKTTIFLFFVSFKSLDFIFESWKKICQKLSLCLAMTSVEKLILIKFTVFSLMYAFVRYDKKLGKQALIMFDGLLMKPPCTI